ncbi:hypothetical protein Tco_0591764, partial [Tanacetum coccineum]
YALWEVIEYGNSFKPVPRTTTNADGTSTSTISVPVTSEEKTQKKNDLKARSMLLMALPNEHLLTFSQYEDAKTLFEAIKARFGGNDATKKTQKTLLKQMYENFNAPSTESLDSIFNRLQKIVSQLAVLGEIISQEDLNLKFLRSLPAEWNTHVVVWKNKPDIETMSFDDLYNNFKIVEQEIKRTVTSSSNSSSQNVAFVSTPSSTNDVNTASVPVSTASTPVSTVVHEDLEQIHDDDLEEMDLKWQLALLSMRARKFYQRTGKKITINGSDTVGSRSYDSRNRNQESSKRTVNIEEITPKAMVAVDGTGFDWSFMADEEVPTNMALMAFSDSEVPNDKTFPNSCLFAPATIDLSNSGLKEFQLPEFEGYGAKVNKSACENSSNKIKKTIGAPIIEDWVLDSDEDESEFTKKACFVCGSFNHLIKDCDFYDKRMVQKLVMNNRKRGTGQREVRPVWNNAMRTNHKNFSNSRRNIAPITVLTKSGIVPISTVRQSSPRAAAPVSTTRPSNTVAPKPFVNVAKPKPNVF